MSLPEPPYSLSALEPPFKKIGFSTNLLLVELPFELLRIASEESSEFANVPDTWETLALSTLLTSWWTEIPNEWFLPTLTFIVLSVVVLLFSVDLATTIYSLFPSELFVEVRVGLAKNNSPLELLILNLVISSPLVNDHETSLAVENFRIDVSWAVVKLKLFLSLMPT